MSRSWTPRPLRRPRPLADPGPDTPIPPLAESHILADPVTDPLRNPVLGMPTVRGYVVHSVIGSGGMGIVYKARHRDLQRTVALKMLRGVWYAEPEFRDRFQAEAEAIARLRHPHIIQVYDIGTVDPRPGEVHPSPYLSLEFVDGGSLNDVTSTPQRPEFVATVVEKLARAAHAAHQVGVIHRDLKPANVLMTLEGEPKIADFGLAKQLQGDRVPTDRRVTQEGTVVGTPEYMAPEQILGEPPTPSIDGYALGVVMYELLTARLPFQGTNLAETMHQVLSLDPVPPRRLQPSVPRDLETICLKCLAKSPTQRYATAEALADDLARWSSGRPILARPASRGEQLVRWARRNPVPAVLSALLLIVTLIGFVGIFWKWREAETNAQSASMAATEARERTEAERWKHYRANIVAATSALQLNNIATVQNLLETAPPEHRNWESTYLQNQLDLSIDHWRPSGSTQLSAQTLVNEGSGVLIRTSDRRLQMWNLQTRQTEWSRDVQPDESIQLISPDGRFTVSNTDHHDILVHDCRTGRLIHTLRGHTAASIAQKFTHNSTRLITSSRDRTIRVWDVSTGQLIHRYSSTRDLGIVAVTAADRVICSDQAGLGGLIWDARTGRDLAPIGHHDTPIVWGEVSRDGSRCLLIEGFPHYAIRVWDTATGRLVCVLRGHTNQPMHCMFSPDGTRIVSSSFDQTVRVWDATTGQQLNVLRGHKGRVYCALFDATARHIVSAGDDRTIRIWDAQSGEALAVLHGHTHEIPALWSVQGGRRILSWGLDNTLRLWDIQGVESRTILRGHQRYVYGVSWHPDGERIASCGWDGTARLWHATKGELLRTLDHGKPDIIVSHVVWHPAGDRLATVSRDNSVRIWDAQTGHVQDCWHIPTPSWKDSRIAFHPSGKWLAAGGMDGVVRIWSVDERREVAQLTGHTDSVKDVVYSPDGRWLASCGEAQDRTVRIWDAITHRPVQTLANHTESVFSLAFNRQSTRLASGSSDGTVRLWSTENWAEMGVLKPRSTTYGLAFTPDGTRVFCACADNSIRIWDVERCEEVGELRGHQAYVHSVALSPDGTRLVSGSGDFTVRLWDTMPNPQRRPRPDN